MTKHGSAWLVLSRHANDSSPPRPPSDKALDTRIVDDGHGDGGSSNGHAASATNSAQKYPAMSRLQQLPLKVHP